MKEEQPGLVPLTRQEMKARMMARKNPPWYVKLGIMPGGGINRRQYEVVLRDKVIKQARYEGSNPLRLLFKEVALRLMAHEYGHLLRWPLEDHSGNPWVRLKHAKQVGFDVRASNRFLRWRRGDKVRWNEATEWFRAQG